MPLFRRESEDARANAWLGNVLLARPLSFTVLTGAAALMVLAMTAYGILGEYTRKARVTGLLAPASGIVKIVAHQAGVVELIEVREGMAVGRDARILTIADGRASDTQPDIAAAVAARLADRRRALIEQRQHALDAMRADQSMLSRRRASLDRELALLERELSTQALRAVIARNGLERALGLEQTGFLSASAVDRERDAVLDQDARIDSMRRSRAGVVREAEGTELEAQSAYARAQSQVSGIDTQLAALEQERIERQLQYRATIVSPAAGSIATVLVEPGQAIMPGTIVATLIPADSRLEAHLFAPSRSIGFVRGGQEVLLRFLAYPHQKFGSHGARITSVSTNPMPPSDFGYQPADGSREPLYRIKAELMEQSIDAYGKREPLQAGMQVEADIRLDRRRLIEWIFEPVLSLAGRA